MQEEGWARVGTWGVAYTQACRRSHLPSTCGGSAGRCEPLLGVLAGERLTAGYMRHAEQLGLPEPRGEVLCKPRPTGSSNRRRPTPTPRWLTGLLEAPTSRPCATPAAYRGRLSLWSLGTTLQLLPSLASILRIVLINFDLLFDLDFLRLLASESHVWICTTLSPSSFQLVYFLVHRFQLFSLSNSVICSHIIFQCICSKLPTFPIISVTPYSFCFAFIHIHHIIRHIPYSRPFPLPKGNEHRVTHLMICHFNFQPSTTLSRVFFQSFHFRNIGCLLTNFVLY